MRARVTVKSTFGYRCQEVSGNLSAGAGATHFLVAGSKGRELKHQVTTESCEFDSETLYFLAHVTPASFRLSPASPAHTNQPSVCLSVLCQAN